MTIEKTIEELGNGRYKVIYSDGRTPIIRARRGASKLNEGKKCDTNLSFRINKEVLDTFTKVCEAKGVGKTNVIVNAIKRYIDDNKEVLKRIEEVSQDNEKVFDEEV